MTGFLPRTSVRSLRALAALALLAGTAVPARAEPLPVVATFSILGDMVEQIGGSRVAVTTLVGPDGDTHVYRPSPADAQAVARARVIVVNGLDFEGWMERLLDASDTRALVVTATAGIDPIEFEGHRDHDEAGPHAEGGKHGHDEPAHASADHGSGHERSGPGERAGQHNGDHDGDHEQRKDDAHTEGHGQEEHGHAEGHGDDRHAHHGHDHGAYDPHAWQDLANARIYARNIARGLSTVDPANTRHYDERLAAYLVEIDTLDAWIRSRMASLPAGRRTVVTSHDAFQYFGRAYGLTFLSPQGISTETEASAKDVARLIRQIRDKAITAVFVENLGDPRLIRRIADETGAVVGGTLYPGALSPPSGPAATYLDMLRTNARVLYDALAD